MLAIKTLTQTPVIFRREVRLMGNQFEISVVSVNPDWAEDRINDAITEINRVEKLLGALSDDSPVNQINRNAGIKPVKTTGEIFRLIDRSIQISELTYGAFDIIYNVDTEAGDINKFASKTKSRATAGYKNIVLDAKLQTVFLKEKGMRIGFGANSKGYAADRAKYVLQMSGVSNGVINAGGDLITWGAQPDNQPWTIVTADPSQKAQPFANVEISNLAIATSANVDKYAALINKRNLNTVNSKKGFPVSGINSASIISTSAELADAMATPLIAIGINAGLYLINQLNQIGCIIIDDHERVYTSKDIAIPLY
jgi:thiamine biosynthesis lipoprotein